MSSLLWLSGLCLSSYPPASWIDARISDPMTEGQSSGDAQSAAKDASLRRRSGLSPARS